ncbi:hypothetical protein GGR57DRAFT_475858 [Xylariaceae sp. FL1272]|nr:hypothetical protein GGR57DRAFT_475858 [Xylariaceae sp. FL1272]
MGSPALKRNAGLSHDIWCLVVEEIESRSDLTRLCLVSRDFYCLTIPCLYRVVLLRSNSDVLSCTLLESKDPRHRNAARELRYLVKDGTSDEQRRETEKLLIALHDGLPFLKRIIAEASLSKETLRHLTTSSKVSLELHDDFSQRVGLEEDDIDMAMPNVDTLHAHVQASNDHMLSLQKEFFNCPNLKSFSIRVYGGYGGCIIPRPAPQSGWRHCFRLEGAEVFPPLESLSLSGYRFDVDQWVHWQRGVQWERLKTVCLGPRDSMDFLKLAAGYAGSLRTLKVELYDDEWIDGEEESEDYRLRCAPLEDFLRTFTSLESLTLRGRHLGDLTVIANHPRLKHLCLHSLEPEDYYDDGEMVIRPVLTTEQLVELDKALPYLESLELDIYRNGEWPIPFLETIATRFHALRSLTLHLELGITRPNPDRKAPGCFIHIEPVLCEESARDLGTLFFSKRSLGSKLNVIVLRTGEELRRYPQRPPDYRPWEQEARRAMVYMPVSRGEVPRVVVKEGDEEDL